MSLIPESVAQSSRTISLYLYSSVQIGLLVAYGVIESPYITGSTGDPTPPSQSGGRVRGPLALETALCCRRCRHMFTHTSYSFRLSGVSTPEIG